VLGDLQVIQVNVLVLEACFVLPLLGFCGRPEGYFTGKKFYYILFLQSAVTISILPHVAPNQHGQSAFSNHQFTLTFRRFSIIV